MRSGTSCFNFTVWKKTFLRFWPIWAANLAFWLLVMPVRGLMAMDDLDHMKEFAASTGGAVEASLFCAVVLAPMAAMAALSHLYSSRAANFTGALPVRREGMFVSHYLAGLAMLLLPNLAVFLLTLLVEAAGGAVEMLPLLFWLGCLCAEEFFFYSFAVCLGMFAGHILALPVFYGIFNCICYALYMTLEWVFDRFIHGWAPAVGSFADELVAWLTPVGKLLRDVRFDRSLHVRDTVSDFAWTLTYEGGGVLLAYAAAAVVLTVCSLLLYRKRQMETAGDVVAVKAMRPVFRYGVAVCAGLFFGCMTQAILNLGTFGLCVSILLWAVVGCFAAQMILDKTFRVFRKWKGSAAVAAAFLLMFAVIGFDLTGYETRIPDPAQVSYVELGGIYSSPNDDANSFRGVRVEDPEAIKLVTGLHRAAVERRDDAYYTTVSMVYHLTDGSTLCRRYDINLERIEDGDDIPQIVSTLINDPVLLRQAYRFDEAEKLLSEGGRLVEVGVRIPDEEYNDYYQYGDMMVEEAGRAMYFSGDDAKAIWDAVLADLDAGNLKRYTIPTEDSPKYVHLEFALEKYADITSMMNAGDYPAGWNIDLMLPDTAEHAVAVLETLGVHFS